MIDFVHPMIDHWKLNKILHAVTQEIQ